jgi:hypothetical protein
MNIPGITVGSVLLVLVSVWLAHRLARSRDLQKQRTDAKLAFRAILEPLRIQLQRGETDTYALLVREKPGIERAAASLRPFIRGSRRGAYDREVVALLAQVDTLTPGITAFYREQATGESSWLGERTAMQAAIEALQKYARL